MKHYVKVALTLAVCLLLLSVSFSPVKAQILAVDTDEATGIASDSATLNGDLTDMGGDLSVNVSFEWGTTTGYGSETTPVTVYATGIFNDSISGLSANTTYHFRSKAVGTTTVYGEDRAFIYMDLDGWGWCPDYRGIADTTLTGSATMSAVNSLVYRVNFSGQFTFTVPGQNDVLPLDFTGTKIRSILLARDQDESLFSGFWLEDSDPDYISCFGQIVRFTPGTVFTTLKPYEFYLRTDGVEISERSRDGYTGEFIVGRFTTYVDQLMEELFTQTSFKESLERVLAKTVVLFSEVRSLITPYIP